MSACFAENALVHDEEQDIRGIAAIEDWIVIASEKYQDTVNVTHIDHQNGATIVTGQVSGNFPGSLIELQFHFILEGDKIINLKIG
jgi:endoglucanase Acf2